MANGKKKTKDSVFSKPLKEIRSFLDLRQPSQEIYSSGKNREVNCLRILWKNSPLVVIGLFLIFTTLFAWIFYIYLYQSLVSNYSYLWGGRPAASLGTALSQERNGAGSARLLDGVIVEESKNKLWPYAVMIENLREVRPQAGLSQASVVYESLVEGGATRFMAVFDPSEVVPEIWPVRSVRPYYIEWSSEYDALLAHCGGSPKALQIIRDNSDIKDLNQISRDWQYFWRDTTRGMPHNLLTSSEKMNFALRDKELRDKQAEFRAWKFKGEDDLENRGEDGKTLTFNFSYGLTYKVSYQYNQEKNVYWRFNADQPHKDRNTDQQIEVKNVVVQLVDEPILSGGQGRLEIQVEGEGKAWILRDGQIIAGTWKKASRTERTLFFDQDGQEIEFNRGNTWVHVVPEAQAVIYE